MELPELADDIPPERENQETVLRQSALFRGPDLMSLITDAMPNVFMILNARRQAIYANQALLVLLGVEDETEVVGSRPGELMHCIYANNTTGGCGTAEACRTCGALQAVMVSLSQRKKVIREFSLLKDDGQALDLEVWATPVEMQDEQFVMVGFKDMTAENRRRVLERVFFHDLLNTASVISGYTELLKYADASEISALQVDLNTAVMRLVDEIHGQRQLAAAESGELAVNIFPFSASKIVKQIHTFYRNHPVAEKRQLEIEEGPDASIMGDHILTGRVVGNMVKNALEATSKGDTVTVGHRLKDDHVDFYVHNPSFMPRNVQLQVFRRSFSTKGEGRGLGTYSMKLLAEQYLHGKIAFESDRKSGTTFIAQFPLEWPGGSENGM